MFDCFFLYNKACGFTQAAIAAIKSFAFDELKGFPFNLSADLSADSCNRTVPL